ncbi:sensor histidine kinase [Flaviaesturariibacter amylovorans]|uniref:Signal transduction histidine kinase internal region domain-containing protein n=1 Tax=Flaviaesturariibacter amylovorans TaxID=1084520 RepID=A0ABP8HNG8_9BACT
MPAAVSRQRLRLYLRITGAWIGLWLFIDAMTNPGIFLPFIPNELWRAAFLLTLHYTLFEHLVPWFRKRRMFLPLKILLALLAIWAISMLLSFGIYAWRSIGVAIGIYTEVMKFKSHMAGVRFQTSFSFFSVAFYGIIVHIHDHLKLQRTAQQLRIEKQEAELNYLKAQTNPHFLFNTLNNIYSLARLKSDLAPESILRLSKILRFMLYETGGAHIALEQELQVINDYIALERLRYDDSLRVSLHHDVEYPQQAVPPLLLMPLVENAFKHGASETRGHPFVDIHLSVKGRLLTFIVKNSADAPAGPVTENIGLANLRRQLELLFTDHHLQVQRGTDTFTATLTINLASHV